MKKFLVVLAIFCAMFFFAACGGGSSNNQNDNSDTGDTVTDGDTSDTGSTDAEPEDGDNSDSKPDSGDSENSDTTPDKDDQPIENNDKDDVIGGNDKDDQPIENEDKDNKGDSDNEIDDNDKDNKDDKDNSDINDNDPIENNDNDNTDNSTGFFESEMVAKKKQLEQLSQDDINDIVNDGHDTAKSRCPYTHSRKPEQYDKAGNMYIVDTCEGNLNNHLWLENAIPYIFTEVRGTPPPATYKVASMTVSNSNDGNQSNIKIRIPYLVLDVNFLSANCLSQVNEDTSVIVSTPQAQNRGSCIVDDNMQYMPFQAKNKKQSRNVMGECASLCATMPDYQLDTQNNTCYTTVENFVWLENVPQKLLPNSRLESGYVKYGISRIERNLDTNMFHMDMTVICTDLNTNMNVHIELKNAKSCIDQCYGQEGCTSHIEQNPNASKGCFINGEEIDTSCPAGYHYNGSTCVNLCDPNPCANLANSNGSCTANALSHVCGCKPGYYWKDSSCTMPECSASSGTPCKDSANGLTWSSKASKTYTWQKAGDYCSNLTEIGYSDWRLPTISELRTLIQNCPAMQSGAGCDVTDNCLSWSDCYSSTCSGCESDSSGKYSKLEDNSWLWSSSVPSDRDNLAVGVNFSLGNVTNDYTSNSHNVRCVRSE
jgi:hypothetical protein